VGENSGVVCSAGEKEAGQDAGTPLLMLLGMEGLQHVTAVRFIRYSAPRPAYHLQPPTCFLFPIFISVPPAPCIDHRRGLATPFPSLFPHTSPSKNPKSQYECPPLSSGPVLQYLHQISFLSLSLTKNPAFRISPRINSLEFKARVPQVSA